MPSSFELELDRYDNVICRDLRERLNRCRDTPTVLSGMSRSGVAAVLGKQLGLRCSSGAVMVGLLWRLVRELEPIVERPASLDPGGGAAVRAAVESMTADTLIEALELIGLGAESLPQLTVGDVETELRRVLTTDMTVRVNRLLSDWNNGHSSQAHARRAETRRDRSRAMSTRFLTDRQR